MNEPYNLGDTVMIEAVVSEIRVSKESTTLVLRPKGGGTWEEFRLDSKFVKEVNHAGN